ncbi:uncharacterized protein LOC112088372 [Eutrema salsugineum]|uniref:uncharacterized protein LOC112088372 n=1 Tax=Eutrema salsugineum TaxID=72664 RepID=UPI000CECE4FE|nr:uncharacterized protein LOC112088372 [Eutrema salsugineum]
MANIDKVLMSLSLEEEEDVPFVLPNLPKYCSCEKNMMSIMGRTLNSECPNMADLILDMPQKSMGGKATGELHEVYASVDSESQHPGQLLYGSIYDLEDIISKVEEIDFDPEKPQSRDYVRVKVNFDVSKPVKIKGCDSSRWGNHYGLDKCPLLIKMRRDKAEARRKSVIEDKQSVEPILKESDPIFGVLSEDQVGVDPNSGRLKINPEVLQEMRLLEHALVISRNVDKGKGPVYTVGSEQKSNGESKANKTGEKLMASVINTGIAMRRIPNGETTLSERAAENFESENSVFRTCSVGFETGSSDASSSGVRTRKPTDKRKITPSIEPHESEEQKLKPMARQERVWETQLEYLRRKGRLLRKRW